MEEDKLPSKTEIFEYGLLIDWCEPSCWVCDFHYEDKYDIKNADASLEDIHNC